MARFTAIEFFSGIGAFSQGARRFDIEVLAAFDQCASANQVFALNYGLLPSQRNLDTIAAEAVPLADIWWMSPPCKPYTVRGKRLDDADTRARSLMHLLELLEKVARPPALILLENVCGFKDSAMHKRFVQTASRLAMQVVESELCALQFGTPMRRPRLFLAAVASSGPFCWQDLPAQGDARPLASFLDSCDNSAYLLKPEETGRYAKSFDIVDAGDPCARTICFTSGYGRSFRASGSYLATECGIRRFSPREILRLLGYEEGFRLPGDLDAGTSFRLAGNSVHIPSIAHVLRQCGLAPVNV